MAKKDKPEKVPKREPRPGEGRPTKYKDEYCEMLIEHMAQGYSYESFAGEISVHRDTLYEWEKIDKFSDSKKIGRDKSLMWWEKQGIDGLWSIEEKDGLYSYSKKLNSTVWIFNMKNKHAWRDSKEEKDTKPNGNTGPQIIVTLPSNGRESENNKN